MSKVEIRSAWIASELDVQRSVGPDGLLKPFHEVFFRDDVRDPALDQVNLFVNGGKQFCWLYLVLGK